MLKRFLLFSSAILLTANCVAQQATIENRYKLNKNITEIFHVTVANANIKQGLYQAVFDKNKAIASGLYENDKKIGVWRFYNSLGQPMQIYDYTKKAVLYEAPEDTTSGLRYFVDKLLDSTSKVTKPIKIGGRYYGYLPYLNLFTMPKDLQGNDYNAFTAVVELLISPYGRLAEYKVHLGAIDFERAVKMNFNLPNPEDMVFIPATLNGEPIASRVVIKCYVTRAGHLDFQ